ncbi:MAG: VWA-like domain-containing protein [Candidatus Ornithomonoglobus sp.]
MALSEEKLKEYNKRLLLSRMRILINNGFYGLLLMHMILTVDESCPTAATDGYRIYFGPEFMDALSDSEIDFVMMHEILHVVLNHCARTGGRDNEAFNIACDIVVNSNILLSNNMDLNSITLKKYGTLMHLTPNNDEGCKYTAEEVYEMLAKKYGAGQKSSKNSLFTIGEVGEGGEDSNSVESVGFELGRARHGQKKNKDGKAVWDDHSRWAFEEEDTAVREVWVKRVIDAAEAIEIQEASNSRGVLPAFAERLLKDLKRPQTDWKTVLTDFIQEEICDYSFSPPDRRFDDSAFYLPDFNGTEIKVSDILFMIDTSGSMSDEMITAAYSEVKGAIDQFDGKLQGWLGFFDAAVIEPQPFGNEEEFKIIKPVGGGGTDFQIVFEYVLRYMNDNPPASIIILTDGYAPFPDKSLSNGIPVLWLLNNEKVVPPWGKTTRIKI